jgi:hypothetical protein
MTFYVYSGSTKESGVWFSGSVLLLLETQAKPVDVYRDNDKDLEYDMVESSVDNGLFGINWHRANSKFESVDVNKFSAGCIVTANPHEYDMFIKICDEAAEVWGNSFTGTLIKESDIQ